MNNFQKPTEINIQNDKNALAREVSRRLRALYPDAVCALKYGGEPWRLLIMAILSAQCTDARVNLVSEELFRRYPTIESVAACDIVGLEDSVRSCGLYKTKAKNIRASCAIICEKYGGELPHDMDVLLSLPGVGRKIANLLRGDIFGLGGIVADTHCIRLCSRLGFTKPGERDPLRTEKALSALISGDEQSDFCHRFVLFGRETCTARSPKCAGCPLYDVCAGREYVGGASAPPNPRH
ncbi:MAG: endonuclease III [Eubacteriales bacterium]